MRKSIRFSGREVRDLAKAWFAISLAFAIAGTGLNFPALIISAIVSALVVGTAFLFHELAHKFVAQRYGCWAEFRSFDNMLLLALFMSLLGFVFAAPGAVFISGHVTKKQNGKISAAGTFVNLVLAFLFLIILLILPTLNINITMIKTIAHYGFWVNSFLAFFNLLPFGMFDGLKVVHWNKLVYGIMMFVSVIFLIASMMV